MSDTVRKQIVKDVLRVKKDLEFVLDNPSRETAKELRIDLSLLHSLTTWLENEKVIEHVHETQVARQTVKSSRKKRQAS